jgi:hypothetical protein
MEVIHPGEKLHIIERKHFEFDPMRHFIGEVVSISQNVVRIRGRVWVFDMTRHLFIRKPEVRERIFVLGERHVVNVLPAWVVIDDLVYETKEGSVTIVTDNTGYSLNISEFAKSH